MNRDNSDERARQALQKLSDCKADFEILTGISLDHVTTPSIRALSPNARQEKIKEMTVAIAKKLSGEYKMLNVYIIVSIVAKVFQI